MKQRYERNRSSEYNFAENTHRNKRVTSLLWLRLTCRKTYCSYKSYVCERSISLTGFPKSNARFTMLRVSLYMKSVGSWDLAHVYGLLIRGMPLARSRASRTVRVCERCDDSTRSEGVNPFSSTVNLPPLLYSSLKSAWNRRKKNLARLPFRRLLHSFYSAPFILKIWPYSSVFCTLTVEE